MALNALTAQGGYAPTGTITASPTPVEAVIAVAPVTMASTADVLIGDATQRTGPCRWAPIVTTTTVLFPAVGDQCLVTVSNQGHHHIVWWTPTGSSAASGVIPGLPFPAFPAPIYEGAVQPGVLADAHCKLSIGSTSSVTLAAGTPYLTSAAGLLTRVVSASTTLGSIPAASVSNFRLDQAVAGSTGLLTRLAGTEGTTVTATNRTGAAAVPTGSQLLYDMLVTSSGVLAANVIDRRPWARGAEWGVQRNGTNYTTSLTSMANLDPTNLYQRIECSGVPLRVAFSASMSHDTMNALVSVGVWVDGAIASGMTDGIVSWQPYIANAKTVLSFSVPLTLPAGSHLVGVAWKVNVGTGTIYCNATQALALEITEIARPNAANT